MNRIRKPVSYRIGTALLAGMLLFGATACDQVDDEDEIEQELEQEEEELEQELDQEEEELEQELEEEIAD